MKDPHRKAVIAIVRMFVVLVAAIFLPVWTFRWWQGWTCLAAFIAPASAITVWVAKHDPALLERRLKAGPKAEKERGQKVVQSIASVVFIADFVIPGFDHRCGWSQLSAWTAILGDVLMLVGFWITFAVFRVNSFTSGIIEVAEGQKVISTGPYAVVRHPFYSGALIMLFGIPLALGSGWGMAVNVLLTAAIIWRLLHEEKFLAANLNGYVEYRQTVKYRLAPLVW
jgi:protein-S-isoprenylcysteine O-methyltransferase Ste14